MRRTARLTFFAGILAANALACAAILGLDPVNDAVGRGDGSATNDDASATVDGDTPIGDANVSADAAACDPEGGFGEPETVRFTSFDAPIEFMLDPRISEDELTIVFLAVPKDGGFTANGFIAERRSRDEPFDTPKTLPFATGLTFLTGDGLTLYFVDGARQPNVSRRASRDSGFPADFSPIAHEVDAGGIFNLQFEPNDEVNAYVAIDRVDAAARDLYRAYLEVDDAGNRKLVNLLRADDLNTTRAEWTIGIAPSGLRAVVGHGYNDENLEQLRLFEVTRTSKDAPWVNVRELTELTKGANNTRPGSFSADGCRLYFNSGKTIMWSARAKAR